MNLSRKTIDALRKFFAQLAHDIFVVIPGPPNYPYTHSKHGHKHHLMTHYNNDFALHPLHGQLPTYHQDADGNLILEFGSQYAKIIIDSVRMRDLKELQIGDPVILSTASSKLTLETWSNSSDSVETHELGITKVKNRRELHGTAQDYEKRFTEKIEREFGVGVEGIIDAKGKLEVGFEQSFAEHFTTELETTDTEEKTEKTFYHVNPHTQTSVFRKQGISDGEQTLHQEGVLDCSFRFFSDSDWDVSISSIQAFEQWVKGGTLDTDSHIGDGEQWLLKYFSERHFENYNFDYSPLKVDITETVDYRDIEYSEVQRNDTPLPKPAEASDG